MKAQSSENASKPAAELVTPGSAPIAPSDQETLRESAERQNAEAKAAARKQKQLGKVAQFLNAKVMVTDRTFPFLTFKTVQLSVSEWYPQLNVAVDKFFQMEDVRHDEIAFKQAQFRANGIQYAYLTPEMDLVDLADQLNL
jgi:hypothetical protein